MNKLSAPLPLQRAPESPTQTTRNKQVYKASQMYETQFLREMMKAMRKSVNESGLIKKNMGEKIFQEKLDHEYIDKWVGKGGVGLSDMIYNHLMEKFYGQRQFTRPKGPVPLQSQARQVVEAQKTKDGANLKIGIEGPSEVVAPWAGKAKVSPEFNNAVIIEHENGLSSSFLFGRSGGILRDGQRVEAGQKIALLGEEVNEFFMRLKSTQVKETL